MKPLEKVEAALRAAKANGIQINAGPSAFDWTGLDKNIPKTCSGFGALILYYELREYPNPPGRVGRVEWWNALKESLEVNGWWLRRFECGFELGRIVYVKTTNKTNIYLIDAKGRKHYYKEDDVSKASIELRKKYS